MTRKMSPAEVVAQVCILIVLCALAFVCLFPFLYVLGVSLTSTEEAMRRGIVIIPHRWTFTAYYQLLSVNTIFKAYRVTLFVTVVGTFLNMLFTAMCAYPLARKSLPGRNLFLMYIIMTMMFSGGMIPSYILVKSVHLINTVWALIIPGLISAYLMFIMKGFFEQLPEAIDEAARIDGAGEGRILLQIVAPLSMPVIATLSLFYAVNHWNSYFSAVLYIHDANKYPVQVVLRSILLSATELATDYIPEASKAINPISLQMAMVIVTIVPILAVYPFIQKHFTKGVLLGSIKG